MMIPTIETIAENLACGSITIAQAIAWLHLHAEGAANELRDHFAGLALAAMIGHEGKDANNCGPKGVKTLPVFAYQYADAMLAERYNIAKDKPPQ